MVLDENLLLPLADNENYGDVFALEAGINNFVRYDIPHNPLLLINSAEEENESFMSEMDFICAHYLGFTRMGSFKVQCFIRSMKELLPPYYISVTTATVLPRLITEPRSKILDFGRISIGRSCKKSVTIRNLSLVEEMLSLESLPPNSPFTIMNAIRPLAPGNTQEIIIEFKPISQQTFRESLRISTPSTQITIQLCANGVAPIVSIDPPNSVFDMGDVLMGDSITTSFLIKNQSAFPLPFDILSLFCNEKNWSGFKEFSFVPSQGVIEPRMDCLHIVLNMVRIFLQDSCNV